MTKDERDELKAAITRRATNAATAPDLALMSKWAKEDSKLYAEVNAEAMQPLYEEQQRKRDEAAAEAKREEDARNARLAARAQQQQENLVRAIDQRMAHHGVPTKAKKR